MPKCLTMKATQAKELTEISAQKNKEIQKLNRSMRYGKIRNMEA